MIRYNVNMYNARPGARHWHIYCPGTRYLISLSCFPLYEATNTCKLSMYSCHLITCPLLSLFPLCVTQVYDPPFLYKLYTSINVRRRGRGLLSDLESTACLTGITRSHGSMRSERWDRLGDSRDNGRRWRANTGWPASDLGLGLYKQSC